jgi:transposase
MGTTLKPRIRCAWDSVIRRFRRWSEAGVWEAVSTTLAEILADSGHYSIDSTTRGADSPVTFTVRPMPEDGRSPFI